MKKIQIVFAVVAVLTASAGVLGNAMLPEVAYFESTSEALSCQTPTFLTPCTEGTAARCVIESGGTNYYINKRVNDAPCIEHRRP